MPFRREICEGFAAGVQQVGFFAGASGERHLQGGSVVVTGKKGISEILDEIEDMIGKSEASGRFGDAVREKEVFRELLGFFAKAGYEQTWRHAAWKSDGCSAGAQNDGMVSIFVPDELISEAMKALGVTSPDEENPKVSLAGLERLRSSDWEATHPSGEPV